MQKLNKKKSFPEKAQYVSIDKVTQPSPGNVITLPVVMVVTFKRPAYIRGNRLLILRQL